MYFRNFSDFGLYRYENASHRNRNNRNGIYSPAIVYSIVAMTVIFSIILYIFLSSRSLQLPSRIVGTDTSKRRFGNLSVNSTNSGLEVIEIAGENSSEPRPKRIRRLDSKDESSSNSSPEQQKLILFPNSRTLKHQPRMIEKQKIVQYTSLPPNHKLSARKLETRANPFRPQSATLMPMPNEFLKPPTGQSRYNQVNNIQDILRSNHRNYYQPVVATPPFAHPNHKNSPQMSQFAQFSQSQMQSVPVQLTGKYRHPRTNVELSKIFQQSQGQLQGEGSDPFRTFKPISAQEINQMINQNTDNQHRFLNAISTDSPYFRRKFRQKMTKHKDTANIYGSASQASNHVEDRNEVTQGKPFSVMLDVFPLPGEENEYQQQLQLQQQQKQQQLQMMQMQKFSKFRPLMSRYYQDPQFFNTMNFPQLMPRYPPYFRYQNQAQASSNIAAIQSNGMMKPSQLIVHLNLYPKQQSSSETFKRSSSTEDENERRLKKQKQLQQQEEARQTKMAMKRNNQTLDISSTPLNINFNVLAGNPHNAHPENVMYQKMREFNRTSTEAAHSDNYFYDDDEDDIEADQSINVGPSMIYKNIYRDRPVYMMLKNRTTTRPPPTIKTNQKFEYHAMNRPKTKYLNYVPKVSAPFYR